MTSENVEQRGFSTPLHGDVQASFQATPATEGGLK